ncbi:restriction modification system DNA specificity domain [gamma proteobacterium HTCC5015]|nr:restriction modification system DNA specificity domain [gamma proteobacterium HTCC5015]
MFSSIPKDWKRVPLSSVSERMKRRNSAGNTNVLTISAVHGLVNQKDFFNKIVASDNLSNYFHLKKGDFAYNKSYSHGYPVGVVRRLEMYDEGVLSPLYICFSMKGEGVDDKFAAYFFDSHWFIEEINEIAKEGARNHGLLNVGVGDFFDLDFVLPPLPEQQKIAAILSSVDEVIEKTRAQIDKLKDLKTGMMQELLTKGIGHAAFKDSPVGRIPEGWDVVALGDLGKWKGGGTPSKSNKDYWNGNIPWVSPKDMKSEFITQTSDQITEEAISESSTNLVSRDSVLVVVRSGILKHTLPVALASCDLALNQDMRALSVNSDHSERFVFQYLQANNHKVLRATLKAGNTVESIDFKVFSDYLIPCPPLEEQEKIALAVEAVGNRIRAKAAQLDAYVIMKQALMQDLLTGKVRVNTRDN